MAERVFISYRREDTAGHAGRLHDSLVSRLGSAEVFMDVGGIGPGVDFPTAIADAVASCDVMLAMIGNRWVTAANPSGGRRLDEPDDYVVAEIAAALERQVRVIPVLIDGGRMPLAAELPARLRGLERRNALTLDTVSWNTDLAAVLAALGERDPPAADERPPGGMNPRARNGHGPGPVATSAGSRSPRRSRSSGSPPFP
ncbi:MAG: toll/interleukin-1 receptor domain-containing protein [Acidimicrobiales bacterium]